MPDFLATRQRLGLTQEAMAERLGVTPRHYQKLERGHSGPSGPVLKLLENMEDGQ